MIRSHFVIQWLLSASMLIGLPLLGAAMAGEDILAYLHFPPATHNVTHAGFSGLVFALFTAVDLFCAAFLAGLLYTGRRRSAGAAARPGKWPAWGWSGIVLIVGGWLLAWTRFGWFAPYQENTFCLPWLGYIITVNALCLKRSGRSLLSDAPLSFLLLFAASAFFWWFFEYLNRFVQNWYYMAVERFGPGSYTILATLAFSTVLPAVMSTCRLLMTFPSISPGLRGMRPAALPKPRAAAVVTLAAASAGLMLLGIFPDALFALVWFAPLLVITSLQQLSGRDTIFSFAAAGDFRPFVAAPLAALICGFFWEMWNYYSLAGWTYSIPYVDRFHLFAMPILGYGGYLPFGLECLMIARMVLGDRLLLPAPPEPLAPAPPVGSDITG